MRSSSLTGVLVLMVTALSAPAMAGTGQLVVPTVQTTGVDPNIGPVITELVLEALLARHGVHALGPADVKDLLVSEEQKQTIGCDTTCMKELTGALGASKLVSGSVGKLGDAYVLTLKLVDAESAQVIARSSKRFNKIEDTTELVGPLVDELLGAKPLSKVEAPKLITKRKEAEKERTIEAVPSFCGPRLDAHQAALLQPEEPGRLIQRRRSLLEDILLTPFLAEVESKIACLKARDATLAPMLKDLRLGSISPEGHDKAQKAELEWAETLTNLPLLLEAYRFGLEKEQNGTGARPIELPFSIRALKTDALDPTPPAEHVAASAIINSLVGAVQSSDKTRFVALFAEPGAKNRPAPRDLYVYALGLSERTRLDPCPWFTLSAEERAAREADRKKTGRTRACLRQTSRDSGSVILEDVEIAGTKVYDWHPAGLAR